MQFVCSARIGLRFYSAITVWLLGVSQLIAANYAERVVDYRPGVGFATQFGSGLGYTNALAAIGAPSRVIPGAFGGPVDPFNPPYLRDQLVSIGAGGSLTVRFSSPILNHPAHPFGIDFLIFGNSGFVITNGNFAGGGITDGSLFANSTGALKVSISQDNQIYYDLFPPFSPSFAGKVDAYFPTDGAGDFSIPVNPNLTLGDFAGKDLSGLRALYGGSGGGAGFDLAWAREANGLPANWDAIHYVRVEVLSDKFEIDGFSAIPEPATWGLILLGLLCFLAPRWQRFLSTTSGRAGVFPKD